MQDKEGREVIDLYKQLEAAYAKRHVLSAAPELGEFVIRPMSAGASLGNLQRMLEIDLAEDGRRLMDVLNTPEKLRELKLETAITVAGNLDLAKQRNLALRRQIDPPAGLRLVWDWDGSEVAADPLSRMPQPMLNELYDVLLKVTRGSYQLTEKGDAEDEAAAKK